MDQDAKSIVSAALMLPQKYGSIAGLEYDIFGDGPRKIVFLCDIGQTRRSWVHQLAHFGEAGGLYTCLVLDGSDRSSIDGQAHHVWEALDGLGWIASKSIHLVGISLGGVVAMKLAIFLPARFASLCLVSTPATYQLAPIIKRTDSRQVLRDYFPLKHLHQFNDAHPGFPTNEDYYLSWTGHLTGVGTNSIRPRKVLSQTVAMASFRITPSQLKSIGRDTQFCQIVVGDADLLLSPDALRAGTALATAIGCKLRVHTRAGHLPTWQDPTTFNKDLENMIDQADRYWRKIRENRSSS
ncbi:hypothetical protein PYCC9005_002313 [Savitreella phatthalungensis]